MRLLIYASAIKVWGRTECFCNAAGIKGCRKNPDNIKISPNQPNNNILAPCCHVFLYLKGKKMRRCEGFALRSEHNVLGVQVLRASFSKSIWTPTLTPTGWLISSHIRSRAWSITCCLRWMVADSPAAAMKEKWGLKGTRRHEGINKRADKQKRPKDC